VAGSLVRGQAKGDAATPVVVMNGAANPVMAADAIPTKHYFSTMTIHKFGNTQASTGVDGDGAMAVTSLTITNANPNSPEKIRIFNPKFIVARGLGGPCTGKIVGGGYPQMDVIVPPSQTLHLPFPSPLVYPSQDGQICIAMEVLSQASDVNVMVNGFLK
jgi:hypothetical protein